MTNSLNYVFVLTSPETDGIRSRPRFYLSPQKLVTAVVSGRGSHWSMWNLGNHNESYFGKASVIFSNEKPEVDLTDLLWQAHYRAIELDKKYIPYTVEALDQMPADHPNLIQFKTSIRELKKELLEEVLKRLSFHSIYFQRATVR